MEEKKVFPDNWIVNSKGELLELGCEVEPLCGFTIEGIRHTKQNYDVPIHGRIRYWENIDDFLIDKSKEN